MEFISPYMNYIIVGAVALGLLVVGTIISRAFRKRTRGRTGMRLGIVEYLEIDENRRLVLVQRDETEHLLLIGGQHDLLVEGGIELRSNIAFRDEEPAARAPIPLRPAPRPPVFGERRPMLRPVDPSIITTPRSVDREEN